MNARTAPSTAAAGQGTPQAPLAGEVTQWLQRMTEGAGSDAGAGRAPAGMDHGVYEVLYKELHRLARAHMRREASEHTLSATGLVHEAWLRLNEQHSTRWQNRGHFMAVASTLMRRILVDHAVAKRAAKREADLEPLSTTLVDRHGSGLDRDVVAVHDALLAFEAVDPRAAKVVELRFFGGLEIDEVAQVLDISTATVKRDWTVARAWLRRELGGTTP
ncbi:MAG: ECF-type sigma factor [Rubrivivax sp.]